MDKEGAVLSFCLSFPMYNWNSVEKALDNRDEQSR